MDYSVEKLFATMGERFKPEVAGDLTATVVYEFEEGQIWTIRIKDGDLVVESNDTAAGSEDARINCASSVFLDIIAGSVNLGKAVLLRKIRISGKWQLLPKVRSAFEVPEELLRK